MSSASIRAADGGIVAQPKFQSALGGLDSVTRAAWDDLIAVATDAAAQSDVARFLDRVRNRTAFHYDRTRLLEGYWHHFRDLAEATPGSDARYSFGSTLIATSRKGESFARHTSPMPPAPMNESIS
jgi:hypothetical protein